MHLSDFGSGSSPVSFCEKCMVFQNRWFSCRWSLKTGFTVLQISIAIALQGTVEERSSVEGCMEFLHMHARATLSTPNRLYRVYALEDAVADLYEHSPDPVSLSKSQCIDMLTTSAFDYESNTR